MGGVGKVGLALKVGLYSNQQLASKNGDHHEALQLRSLGLFVSLPLDPIFSSSPFSAPKYALILFAVSTWMLVAHFTLLYVLTSYTHLLCRRNNKCKDVHGHGYSNDWYCPSVGTLLLLSLCWHHHG